MAAGCTCTHRGTPDTNALLIGMTQPQPHQRPQLPPLMPTTPRPAPTGRRLIVTTGILQLTVGLCAGLGLAQLATITALGMCPQRAAAPLPQPQQSIPFAVRP